MTNPADTARAQFEIVRRGYEPQQVDRTVSALARDLQTARARTTELERRIEELHVQGAPGAAEDAPTFAGLGARIESILGLAEDEAKDLRARALAETDEHRGLSEQAADKVRAEAERYAQERRSEADAEAARVLEDARRQADQLRDSTERDTKARREEAEALFESNRAKAAQAAADFETTLKHRRDQAEHDYTEQMQANQNQLAVVAQRAEQLRLEAEKLRADADRKSKRVMEEAQRLADETINEAKAAAERIRSESDRELAAATQRRDSINAQLTNVRQMLATLTGATLPNPLGDLEPTGDAPSPPAKGAAAPASNVTPEAPKDRSVPGGPVATGKPGPAKPDQAKLDQAKPDQVRPGLGKPEQAPNESAKGGPAGSPATEPTAGKPAGQVDTNAAAAKTDSKGPARNN